jgi:alkanesulfonate monooxygenase SsuD/methylene tetrahydromethanopterin reductase-like flavin-dependent oxidoreductase (luciferase family)
MKLGVTLPGGEAREAGRRAREAEDLGASAGWSSEMAPNGFRALAVAAGHTRRVSLGAAVAVAASWPTRASRARETERGRTESCTTS